MANRFNLTAQMQLQAPTNVPRIANQISRQLNGISADVKINANPRQLAQANKQLQGMSKATTQASTNMGNLNRSLSEAARRFSVITIATGSLLALSRSIKNAFGGAIEFERQLIKIEQVTGKSVKQLSGLTKEITRLSTSLGASSKDLLGISRILTQAGFEVTKVKSALDILAKTTLGATFEDIEDTTEGAVAALRQFGDEAKRVGGDIKFLERTMDAINSVSKNFAVESGDLITVIRRVGGVFEAAGGNVNELIALFTSVRSTTRETAETIATGLRTIFTRLQRTDTVDQLQQLGIELRNSKGEFVGAFEAVSRLSAGLSSLNPRDFRFSEIVESLGGFRQIGKVIPLIKQFTVAQDALRIAQESSGSVAKDAATAQQSLSVQFDKTKEKFDALVRNLADSTSFQTMARLVLKLADAFTQMVNSLEPLLPLLLPLMGLKLGRALAPGIAALAGASRFTRKNEGGPIRRFATGGVVPGTGNRDTVPAMLTPGEFVIRKSSVRKLGAETLAQMNNNRYAKGGKLQSAKLNRVVDGDSLNISATPTGEPFNTSSRLIGYDAYELNKGTRQERALGQKAKKMAEAEYGNKKSVFRYFKGYGKDKFGRPMYKDDKFGEKMIRAGVATRYSGSGARATKGTQARKKALGGMIQKYAAGGAVQSILKTNLVGSAALETGKNEDLSMGAISIAQIKGSRYLKGNNFAQNAGAVSKYLKSQGKSAVPNYTLKRGSLNQATSSNFSNELLTQIGSAVDRASKTLGEDLIGKPVSASSSAKAAIRSKFAGEGGVVGDLFEATLNTISNSGAFASARLQQPFDFPNGLSGPAANNFGSTLPDGFVDARKAQSVKPSEDKASFRRKIINQLGLEVAGSSFAKSTVKKKSKGGGIGTDTVPALLTPGEFVINKDAARRIGQANLDSMNKKGVSRFATGGTVGGQKIQRLNRGGFGDDSGGRILPINIDTVPFEAQLSTLVSKLDQLGISVDVNSQEFKDGLGQAGLNLEKYAQTLKSKADEAATSKALSGEVGPNEGGIGLDIKSESISDVMSKPLAEKVALTTQSNKIDKDINKRKSKLGSTLQTRINDNSLSSKIQGELQKEMTIEKSQLQESDPSKSSNGETSTGGSSFTDRVQRVQGIAQSAQNFVFAGGAAAALTAQFLGLESAMSKAVTQTIGFATAGIGFVGTIVDLSASVAISIAARRAEAISSGEVTAANNIQAASTLKSAGQSSKGIGGFTSMLGKAGGPLLGLVAAVAAVGLAMTYFSNLAKAEAEELGKANDDYIDKLGKGQDFGAALQTGVRRQVAKGEEAQASSLTGTASVTGMAAGGLAATIATFATIGALGGPVGIALGAVVGTAVGLTTAFALANSEADALAKKHKEQRQVLDQVVGSYASLLVAQNNFRQDLADIDAATGLKPEERLSRRLESQSGFSSGLTEQNQATQAAGKTLIDLAEAAGKSVSALDDSDFKDMPLNAQRFKFATKQLEEAQRASSFSAVEYSKTLNEAAAIEISGGGQTLEGLLSSNGAYAQAFRGLIEATKQEVAIKQQAIQVERASIQEQLKTTSGEDRAALIQQENALIKDSTTLRNREKQRIADITTGAENQIASSNEAADAQRQLAAAAQEAAERMRDISNFGNDLALLGKNISDYAKGASDLSSLASGGIQDFSFGEILGLNDLRATGDAKEFSRDLDGLVRDLPNGLKKQGKSLVESVKTTAFLLQEGQAAAAELVFNPTEGKIGAKETRELIDKAGLDPDAIPDNMFGQIQKALQERFKEGISAKEFGEIFDPFIKEGNEAAKLLKQSNGLRNQLLEAEEQNINALIQLQRREIEVREKSVQTSQRAEEFRRRARGLEQTATSRRADSLALSRNRLSGTNAQAGNLGSIIATRDQAQRALERSFAKSASLDDGAKKRAEIANQAKLQEVIKVTTEELDHFASTTEDAVNATLDRINEEKQAREVQKSVIEQAVIGGGEERRQLARTMFNVQKAFATGTLQNQSPEDRSATVALLDKFDNVFLPGAGMTGGDLKELLIRSDARRMGLSEEAAIAIFDQTSVEKQLIQSVDNLAGVMNRIAAAQGIQAQFNPAKAKNNQFGGVIYRNEGGTIFQPKGTDTVPAMLTPGEFVVRKSAVDKVGVGTLNAINQGQPLYRANGGPVYLNQGSSGKIKLNPYDEGDKTRAGDRESMDASFKAAVAGSKESEFYRRPDTPQEIKRKESRGIGEAGAFTFGFEENPSFSRATFTSPSKMKDDIGRSLVGQGIARIGLTVTDPSFLESPENRASRLFGSEYDETKKASDQARAVSGQMKESRTEAGKLDYSAQILAAGGPKSEVSALYRKTSGGDISPFMNPIQSLAALEDSVAPVLGIGDFDDPTGFGKQPERAALNRAMMIDNKKDAEFLGYELKKLEAAYKSGSEYRGINFSERIRDDVRARRYNDIKSSIENRIRIIRKAVAYDYSEADKAKRLVDAKEAAKARKIPLEQYYQQERDRVAMESAGYSAEEASEYSGVGSDMDDAYKRGNFINNDVFKSNVQYARLWKNPKTGQPYDNPSENKGYGQAVLKALQIAQDKFARNSPSGKSKWSEATFEEKLSAANNEMHTIASLKRSNADYKPKRIKGPKISKRFKKLEAEMDKTKLAIKRSKDQLQGEEFAPTATDMSEQELFFKRVQEEQNADPFRNETFSETTRRLLREDKAKSDANREAYRPLRQADAIKELERERERNLIDKQREKTNRVQKKIEDRRNNELFKKAENYIIDEKGGRPYSTGDDMPFGETAKGKASRIANNERINREYQRLRKENIREVQNQTKAKTEAEAKSQVNSSNVIGPLSGMTAKDVAVDESQFTRGQQRRNQRAGVDYNFLSEKNAAMLKLYQQGWVTKDEKQKKKALYAIDSGFRQAAGTRSENWYLGVANQQIMAFGKNLERQQAEGFATGGSINGGMDSVPAMLTPGEFVMSREAVAKHGVGYMKNLNMGKATGFRRGGVVGTGNVQYKANGGEVNGSGGMMIDPSLLSETLNGFSAAFSEQMSTITKSMSGIANQLQGIADSFGSLTMFHTFAGELSMNVNISNKDAIIAAVSDGLLPMIANQIQAQIDASANTFNAGG